MKNPALLFAALSLLVIPGAHATEGDITLVPRAQPLMHPDCKSCHQPGKTKGPNPHSIGPLKHMDDITQCTLCHHRPGMERLNLLDGTVISLDDSPTLCGQCHGEKLGKWRDGIHGKKVGRWNGAQSRLGCVYCHESHHPKFPAMKAAPMPNLPPFVVLKEEEGKSHE
jgi:hypothetical protein